MKPNAPPGKLAYDLSQEANKSPRSATPDLSEDDVPDAPFNWKIGTVESTLTHEGTTLETRALPDGRSIKTARYPNGSTQFGQVVSGSANEGAYEDYSSPGHLESRGFYRKNKRHGWWIIFAPVGGYVLTRYRNGKIVANATPNG